MVGLLGPNGSGKSTFVNCVCGTLRNESGTVRFDGTNINGLTAHERTRLGMARTEIYTREDNGVKVPVINHDRPVEYEFSPPLPSYVFPLDAGKSWSLRVNATNPTSGAYGIPQALPGSKMGSAGSDWKTNPATQIAINGGSTSGQIGTALAVPPSVIVRDANGNPVSGVTVTFGVTTPDPSRGLPTHEAARVTRGDTS